MTWKHFKSLLTHADEASRLCRERYKEYLDILDLKITNIELKLSELNLEPIPKKVKIDRPAIIKQENDTETDLDEDKISESESKRSDKGCTEKKRKKEQIYSFLNDKADVAHDNDNTDEEDDEDEESDLEGFLDDNDCSESNEEDEIVTHQQLDNIHRNTEKIYSPSPPNKKRNKTENAKEHLEKTLKRYKQLLSKLIMYCDQLVVFGFNSQRYDIPLIKDFLPGSMTKLDSLPRFVIKKDGGYMIIASKRLNFLDITNYLAAGTSLDGLYKSYGVSTVKGKFPYEYFDCLEKLNETSLPPQEAFYSTLTDSHMNDADYQASINDWNKMPQKGEIKTFADYIKYYNDNDVIGLVEAIQKMLDIKVEDKLDPFKDSVSLPGLTQKYLFQNLDKNDYFVGFGKEHKHLYKLLRENIIGGPSIIFHRWQEAGITYIKGKNLCMRVIGLDANSLYLWCLAQLMPTGYYTLREKKKNFAKQTRYSSEAIQWLEHMIRTTKQKIRHATNNPHGEVRIENYSVDGYAEETKTIYEYYGCYHHGHSCTAKADSKKWKQTMNREEELRSLGYKIISITSCKWKTMDESKIWYDTVQDKSTCTMIDILNAVRNNEIYGFVQCSIHVPEEMIKKFSEFPPIFKNTEITTNDIG